jgi:hypothetical protein
MIAADYLFIRPNWTDQVAVSWKWNTSIQTVLTGREKRSALYTWPRRGIRYNIFTISEDESNVIKQRLFKNLHNPIGVPIWPDRTSLTSQANSGQAVLNVESTQYRNFDVGGLCVLLADDGAYEAGEVASYTPTSVTLSSNLSNVWPVNTDVFPVIQARFRPEEQLNFITSHYGRLRVDVEELYDADITYPTYTRPSYTLYRGVPVFDFEPNWINEVAQTIRSPFENHSFLGKTYWTTERTEASILYKMGWAGFSRPEVYSFTEFYNGGRGRFDHFWCPSWISDVRITAGFGAGDTTLSVAEYDFNAYWAHTDITGQHLIARFANNTWACTQVLSQSGTTITIEPPLGTAVAAGGLENIQVCLLNLVRFNGDRLSAVYEVEDIATIKSGVITIFYPETDGLLPAWQGSYSYSSWQGNSYAWQNYNLRVVIPEDELSDDQSGAVRVTLGYYDSDYTVTSLWIGHQGAGGSIDFDGSQTQITFSGSNSVDVSTGGVVSDYVSFSYDGTENLVFAAYFGTSSSDIPSSLRGGLYDGEVWYKSGSDEGSTTTPSGYTDNSSTEDIDIIEGIEFNTDA